MQIFFSSREAAEPADARHFHGTVRVQRTDAVGTPHVPVFRVEFEPGARTNWHAHSGVQILLIIEGRGRVQTWGEAVQEVRAGDTVAVAPGDKHWHGAARDARMVHLAVNIDTTTEWMEAVEGD
jgi:quercetin dioxygenase-like cupin family protein